MLQVGRITWTPDDDFPQVQVQGIVRKRETFWSVTLFLVNGQEEPKKLRDMAWLFQPELSVESADGDPEAAARLANDPKGKLTFRESILANGEAAQTTTLLWEDYTTLAMDPSDDCTFWYVGDYYKKEATTYSTRIGGFRLGECSL